MPEPPLAQARRISLSGQVQGVGFRPFVHRLAHAHGIRGWVLNASGRVEIHAEGTPAALRDFARDLVAQAPPLARPEIVADAEVASESPADFRIRASRADAHADIHLPADSFVCPDCLAEMRDPADRRHRYAFINCTQCGPRYTLITALPYDRPNTSLAGFPLCADCRREYSDPSNRRFHAEPVACPACGPHLRHVGRDRQIGDDDAAALAACVATLRAGGIVAVKGIGGYHLMCDAGNAASVAALRTRKPRPAKPLAVMFPDLDALRAQVEPDDAAIALLASPARPIVLLPKRPDAGLAANIAPGLGEIGCLLPYSPLHHLLLTDFAAPLVATSGNLGGEPVLTDNAEAETRLAHIADAFLHHNRDIVRPADDSVYRPIAGRPRPLRLGRGAAPLEIRLPAPLPEPVLALGSHMKNCLCLAWGERVVVSPHIGELDSARGLDTLTRVAEDLQRLYQIRARRLLLDRHPGYGYRAWARTTGLPMHEIWHHHAHAAALAGEHPQVGDWILFTWDGVGLGPDGSLWGGEALCGRPGAWRRRASFRPVRLPGGDKAGRAPWRSAAALLWEDASRIDAGRMDDDPVLPDSLSLSRNEREQLPLLRQAWRRGINSPVSTAAGRLFDAASALLGLGAHASFEGEGPMRLEALAGMSACAFRRGSGLLEPDLQLPLLRDDTGVWRSDWSPLIPMLTDAALTRDERAYRFHASLAGCLLQQADKLRAETGCQDVGLAGGVFQNRLLTELAVAGLEAAGFRVHLGERIPINDAGVSYGQILEFLHGT